ncbi:MAG: ABC transporter permease, partial [Limnochordia bacterium]
MKILRSDHFAGYVFIAPWLFGFLAVTIAPIVISLYFSFTKYDILSAPQWVGLMNYETMFK